MKSTSRTTFLLLLLTTILSSWVVSSLTAATVQEDFEQYFQHFTQFPTRMVGSPENKLCAEFIEAEFNRLGLEDVQVEEFDSVVPIEKGGTMTFLDSGVTVPLYGLWPNLVRTSTLPEGGVMGPIIDVGRGDYSDYNGKEIEGSIALMDFASEYNYIKARSLGAKAIVFYDNGYVNYTQSVSKFLEVPADIPRFWIDAVSAGTLRQRLKQQEIQVHLESRMDLETVKSWNVYGFRYSAFKDVLVTLDGGTQKRLVKAFNETVQDASVSIERVQDRDTIRDVLEELNEGDADDLVLAFNQETLEAWRAKAPEDFRFVLVEDKVLRNRILKKTDAWKLIALNGYYDSTSVVPALAPGAESASSISSLLAVTKHLDPTETPYSLMFFASGNHFGGLKGTTEFLYWHCRSRKKFAREVLPEHNIPINLFVGLDMTSANDQVATTAMGCYFYNWQHLRLWDINKNKLSAYPKLFDELLNKRPDWKTEDLEDPLRRHVNAVNPPKKMWRSYFATRLAFEAEAASHTAIDAITFFTPYDTRTNCFTPNDTVANVNLPNLSRQVETVHYLLSQSLLQKDLFPETKFMVEDYGRDILGKVYEFDRKKRFVPEDKIPGALVTYRQGDDFIRHLRDVSGVKTIQMLYSLVEEATVGLLKEELEPGDFYIKNILFTNANLMPNPGITFAGYLFDKNGNITSMPDLGQDGAKSYPLGLGTSFELNKAMVMLFPCRTMAVYDIVDSRYLRILDAFNIFNSYDAEPLRFGKAEHPWQFYRERDVEPVIVIGTDEGERLKVIGSTGVFGVKYLLTNAPDDLLVNPIPAKKVTTDIEQLSRGDGYPMETTSLSHCAYKAARDMWVLDDVRIKSFSRYGIRNDRLSDLHAKAREALMEAREYLKQKKYDAYMAAVQRGWGLEARGYPDVKATMHDTVSGVLFYFGSVSKALLKKSTCLF